MKFKKILLISVLSLLIVIIGIIVGCNLAVIRNGNGRVYDRAEDVPHNTFGLLLATSTITQGGAHNFYFTIELPQLTHFSNSVALTTSLRVAEIIAPILNSGDEPATIRDSLVSRGIPSDRIILDYEGTRTLNSIVKARQNGIQCITFISQRGHNERAIRIADHLGMNTIAYNAIPSHIRRNRIKNTLREYLARVKMYLDFVVSRDPIVSDYEDREVISNALQGVSFSEKVSIFGITTDSNESAVLTNLATANILKIDTLETNERGFQSAIIEFAGVKFCANNGFVFITSQHNKESITAVVKEISKFYGEPDVTADADELEYRYYDWNLYDGDGPHIKIRPLHSDEGGLVMIWQFNNSI